jgi:penicillin-binding protein 1A
MEFQKLTYVDNGVPSLSIGGFTNGVRVVDMAKGYSTLANRGVYDEQTCIVRIEHQQQGELTKHYKPFAKQVYQEDSAFMLTDILKGTLTESYGTGRGLALENGMPAAGKTGTTNSHK